jgi:hypothetical protein
MKHLTTAALMLSLGIASPYAQQAAEEHSRDGRVGMKFSGSTMSTTLALAPNTLNHESHVAGSSSLGPFTYRGLWADDPASQSPGSCGSGFGPNFRVVAGGGVFRFEDGSLLTVQLTEGTACIDIADPAHPVGRQFETYQITGGTGRFKHVAATCGATAEDCTLQLTATRAVVLFDSAGAAKFLTFTGAFQGTVPHFNKGDKLQ